MRSLTSSPRFWHISRNLNLMVNFAQIVCVFHKVLQHFPWLCDTHSFILAQMHSLTLCLQFSMFWSLQTSHKLLITSKPSSKVLVNTQGDEGTVNHRGLRKQSIRWGKPLLTISSIILTLEISYQLPFSTGDYCPTI